jgi:hypothetical protein
MPNFSIPPLTFLALATALCAEPNSIRCGFTITPGDGEALTERILALAGDRDLCASMGARARMAFEHQWDKEKALAEWEALLQPLVIPISVRQPSTQRIRF